MIVNQGFDGDHLTSNRYLLLLEGAGEGKLCPKGMGEGDSESWRLCCRWTR
jgi:hypothetical protein